MKIEYPSQDNLKEEGPTVRRTLWFTSPPVSAFLTNAVKVVTVVTALWGIGYSLVSVFESRLIERENRLIERMDASHRELSAQISGLDRSMVEGFKETHQRMDLMDNRMDRMDGRMDRIESDIDAIEKHLYRISPAIEDDASPGVITPAVATPDARVSSPTDRTGGSPRDSFSKLR